MSSGKLRIHYAPFYIDELIDAVNYINTQEPVGALFIDYIQLLNSDQKYQSRQVEIQGICNKLLNDLAIPTGIPLILGAQFNREVQTQDDMDSSKIREAGDIEQTANLVVALWNKGFNKDDNNKKPNVIYTTVLKNRDGLIGLNNDLEFRGNTGKIKNITNISMNDMARRKGGK